MIQQQECRLLSVSSILGYGYPESSLELAMKRRPHFIGVDGGSTDPGPHYLGSGELLNSPEAMQRDLRLMLRAAVRAGIPLIIGSCGGAGGEPHLQAVAALARTIARDERLRFKMALIHAEQMMDQVQRWLAEGRIQALRNAPPLTKETLARSSRIVGMMGAEPFIKAFEQGAQVVLAGRASDAASWAACAMYMGLPPAPAWYAGKMLECGTASAVPKGHDCLLASVRKDHVEVEPANPQRRCTPLSVATHALHENASPSIHEEPGGTLDATDCTFEAVSARAVKVGGMRWQERPYDIKLEGAELAGYRAITVCGTRDPVLIGQIDSYLETTRTEVARRTTDFGIKPEAYRLVFHVYGKNGVMGNMEPIKVTGAHELGILAEVVGASEAEARAVLAIVRVVLPKIDFEGRLCKSGNMAFPFSPSDIYMGPAYRFSVFHVVRQDDPLAMFPIDYEQVA